jgi:RNA polymerase sigma-70 factor, ECF subfamily
LNRLDTIDGEVLALRHFFEHPGRAEAAQVLGIDEAGAKRYLHALKGLKDVLATMPGGWKGPRR